MLMATSTAERFEEFSSNDDDYFAGSNRTGESDFCSREGAHALAMLAIQGPQAREKFWGAFPASQIGRAHV